MISIITASNNTGTESLRRSMWRYFTLYMCSIVVVVVSRNTFFTSAFATTRMKPPSYHRNLQQIIHPNHSIRISSCIGTRLLALPQQQRMSKVVTGRSKIHRSFGNNLRQHQEQQQPSLSKQQQLQSLKTSTALSHSVIPIATAATSSSLLGVALMSAISGGIFSGGLHAIAGPDHLAALLPRCIGQRWYRAVRVGAIWGIGHGISATILGCIAFLIKRTVVSTEYLFRSTSGSSTNPLSSWGKLCLQFLSSKGSNVMEIAVGLSLIVIGIMGIKEAREFKFEYDDPVSTQPQTLHNLSAAVNVALTDTENETHHSHSSTSTIPSRRTRAILFNGILHGFSWDGAPSLAPALALMTWGHTITFLSSYAFGTMITMALVTTLIGEGTRQASQIFQRPDLPQKFSFASSILAISIGIVWCAFGLT